MPSRRLFAITVVVSALAFPALPVLAAEDKVASFESGEAGTDAWEDLSFTVDANGRRTIRYSHGKDRSAIDVEALGVDGNGRDAKLRIGFPDGRTLAVSISGKSLAVDDGKGPKPFRWEYEGPIDGRGTFCQPCVDEPEAIPFVRSNFMRPSR